MKAYRVHRADWFNRRDRVFFSTNIDNITLTDDFEESPSNFTVASGVCSSGGGDTHWASVGYDGACLKYKHDRSSNNSYFSDKSYGIYAEAMFSYNDTTYDYIGAIAHRVDVISGPLRNMRGFGMRYVTDHWEWGLWTVTITGTPPNGTPGFSNGITIPGFSTSTYYPIRIYAERFGSNIVVTGMISVGGTWYRSQYTVAADGLYWPGVYAATPTGGTSGDTIKVTGMRYFTYDGLEDDGWTISGTGRAYLNGGEIRVETSDGTSTTLTKTYTGYSTSQS